jgi:cytochrome c-type biogenesis protein CcmF
VNVFELNVHHLGDFLLHASIVVCAFVVVASVVGQLRSDGRLLLAAERGGYVVSAFVGTGALLLLHAFLTHDYQNKYVAHYSDNNMPWYYLLASFWGGQAGSLMFWSTTLAVVTTLVIRQNRDQNRDLLPTVLSVLCTFQAFFLMLMVLEANPFESFRINEPPVNGKGLEPLLQNPAMTFHPPSILSGYVWFSVPFAFAIAALIHRRLDDVWIRATRRYAVISWAFLSMGNLFGGMWAYQELGWGGFWGWDPVENAALMPWISATAYLHSVMIQERRGLLKVWNVHLVLLTGFLTFFGTFLTRAGVIDSVHTFAQSDIGEYFVVMLIVVLGVSHGLMAWRVADGSLAPGNEADAWRTAHQRWGAAVARRPIIAALGFVAVLHTVLWTIAVNIPDKELRSAMWLFGYATLAIFGPSLISMVALFFRDLFARDQAPRPLAGVEHLASREGVFLLNNFILMTILAVVMFGTIGDKLSMLFWSETKFSAPWYNSWIAPLGVVLLLLMGVGPLVPWRKMSVRSFRANMFSPAVAAIALTAAVVALNPYNLQAHLAKTSIPFGEVPIGQLMQATNLTGVYSVLGFYGFFFTVLALGLEFWRNARVRAENAGESAPTALARLISKNRRRYGGYITHLGFASLFLGFVGTGLKTELDLTFHADGEQHLLEGHVLTFRGFHNTDSREYEEWFARFDVHTANADGTPDEFLGQLHPSRRFYHGANVQMSRTTTEKDELDGLSANLYLALVSFKPGLKTAEIMAHYNPMILWMWIGGAFLLVGVVFAVWPEREAYPVFSAARRRARRAEPAAATPDTATGS